MKFKIKKRKKEKREKKINEFLFVRFLPTMISLLAVCSCLTAIKFAYMGKFIFSVSLVLFSCFLDGIDGRVARFFGVSSNFGVEIDSLADAINFGVTPAFVIYFWKINEINFQYFYWFSVMLLSCCMIIRLARFNSDLTVKDQNSPLVKFFFVGMPAPAVAGMVLWPLILSFEFGNNHFYTSNCYVICNTILLALFAASRIPTPCFKKIKIPVNYKLLVLIFSVMFIILCFIKIWLALSLLGILYVISILIGIMVYLNFKKKYK